MTRANDNEAEAPPQAAEPGRLGAATDKLRETAGAAGARAGEAYAAARERTLSAYGTARERAGSAYEATRGGLDANPVAALAGGLAVGAILAAVLPRSRAETELLGVAGRKLKEGLQQAAGAAKESGIAKLDELGVGTVKTKLAELANTKK